MTRIKTFVLSSAMAALTFSSVALAISPAQQHAIERLGQLNGTALQCGYFEETKRLKEAMVNNVPKIRALGALFEDATDSAFMNNLQNKSACPAPAMLEQEIGKGIKALRDAFADK